MLMSVWSRKTIVISMQIVQIDKDHTIVLVMKDTLGMDSRAKVINFNFNWKYMVAVGESFDLSTSILK